MLNRNHLELLYDAVRVANEKVKLHNASLADAKYPDDPMSDFSEVEKRLRQLFENAVVERNRLQDILDNYWREHGYWNAEDEIDDVPF